MLFGLTSRPGRPGLRAVEASYLFHCATFVLLYAVIPELSRQRNTGTQRTVSYASPHLGPGIVAARPPG